MRPSLAAMTMLRGVILISALLLTFSSTGARAEPPQPSPVERWAAASKKERAASEKTCRACDDQACALFAGGGRPRKLLPLGESLVAAGRILPAVAVLDSACTGGVGKACLLLAPLLQEGAPGLPHDEARAAWLYKRACGLGAKPACDDLVIWGNTIRAQRNRELRVAKEAQAREDVRRARMAKLEQCVASCDRCAVSWCQSRSARLQQSEAVAASDELTRSCRHWVSNHQMRPGSSVRVLVVSQCVGTDGFTGKDCKEVCGWKAKAETE
jgi:hypothetical protein